MLDMMLYRPSGATIDLMRGTYSTANSSATISSVENVRGTNLDDIIIGSDRSNRIEDYGGSDTIIANGGDDIIRVNGDGNNLIIAGRGDDDIMAGWANDIIRAGDGDDTIWNSIGTNRISGNDGADTIFSGGVRNNIYGGNGNDILVCGDGDDRMFGGDGDDMLAAGPGNDVMGGGAGADRFSFVHYGGVTLPSYGSDRILDFDTAEDTLAFDNVTSIDDLSIRQVRNDTVIRYGDEGGRIVLKHVDATTLTEDNFIFYVD